MTDGECYVALRDKNFPMLLGLLVLHVAGATIDDLVEHLAMTYPTVSEERINRFRQAIRHWQNLQPHFAERIYW